LAAFQTTPEKLTCGIALGLLVLSNLLSSSGRLLSLTTSAVCLMSVSSLLCRTGYGFVVRA
jgi:hypothetical protein